MQGEAGVGSWVAEPYQTTGAAPWTLAHMAPTSVRQFSMIKEMWMCLVLKWASFSLIDPMQVL